MLLNQLMINKEIVQVHVSKSLNDHKLVFFSNYYYYNLNLNTLFWGVYNEEDYKLIINHKGFKLVYWHDNDCNPSYKRRQNIVNKVKVQKNIIHICDNKNTSIYLDILKIPHIFIENNMSNISLSNKYNISIDTNDMSVSVIVPMYNSEKTIQMCLDSLLMQTYKNINIVVIDDCSTDNSYNIVKQYSKYYGNIFLYKTDINSGCYVARNIGIKKSLSDLIAFQDADDISLPTRIEKQVNIIKGGKELCGCKWFRSKYIFDNITFEKILKENKSKLPILAFATMMIKRNVFNKIGYLSEKYRHSMDYEFYDRYYFYKKKYICDMCVWMFFSKNSIENEDFYYIINEILYISQPLGSNNITTKFLDKLTSNDKINLRNEFILKYDKLNFIK